MRGKGQGKEEQGPGRHKRSQDERFTSGVSIPRRPNIRASPLLVCLHAAKQPTNFEHPEQHVPSNECPRASDQMQRTNARIPRDTPAKASTSVAHSLTEFSRFLPRACTQSHKKLVRRRCAGLPCGKKYIVRLDVAMHDAICMRESQCDEQLRSEEEVMERLEVEKDQGAGATSDIHQLCLVCWI